MTAGKLIEGLILQFRAVPQHFIHSAFAYISGAVELLVGEGETQGVREEMEDQHTLVTPIPNISASRSAFIGVYDGHGGKKRKRTNKI